VQQKIAALGMYRVAVSTTCEERDTQSHTVHSLLVCSCFVLPISRTRFSACKLSTPVPLPADAVRVLLNTPLASCRQFESDFWSLALL